ncbi:hypothetical protein [Mangrovimonas aestuarii]|uniref:hypothetical protein n=1 Tax=Mangrovimonas aestuarii TaxID=3018443 RepID=UPI0023789DC9|nr:hypothetical protein [Mangrovimonas aestuarii]
MLGAIKQRSTVNKKDKDLELIIADTVGYMLKVLKNKKNISDVRFEFNSIKHGNFNEFIQLIDSDLPIFVVGGLGKETKVYGEGNRLEEIKHLKNECNFVQMLSSANALKIFSKECFIKFGSIQDDHIPNTAYKKLAIFEIRIRVHASNHGLITEDDKLESIINKLCEKLDFSETSIMDIHNGRKYLNKVKHHKKNNFPWQERLPEFLKAYDTLTEKKIRLL